MDLIERYVDEVSRRLPPARRAAAASQLRERIDEALRRRAGSQTPSDADIEAVLLEMGDPSRMADQIRGSARCLIGPELFEPYWLVLRIVLLAAGFGILVAKAVELAANPPAAGWTVVGDWLGSVWNALLGAFAMVTVIFALIEYFSPEAKEQIKLKARAWNPAQLPARQTASLKIKPAEPIVAMIFMVVFLVIINVNLSLIGLYIQSGEGFRIVPVLSDYFRIFIPWINLVTAVALILEAVKLVTGRWTIPLVIGSLIQKTMSLIISVQLFSDTRLFDARFFPEIRGLLNQNGTVVPADIADRTVRILLIITIAGFVLDVLTTGWKAVRIALTRRQ